MDWPAQSPDLNPIVNLWKIVKECIGSIKLKNQAWNIEVCMELEPENAAEIQRLYIFYAQTLHGRNCQ